MSMWTLTRKHDMAVRISNAIRISYQTLSLVENEVELTGGQLKSLDIAIGHLSYVWEKIGKFKEDEEKRIEWERLSKVKIGPKLNIGELNAYIQEVLSSFSK